MRQFQLTEAAHQQILSHCQASLPNEACGLLAQDPESPDQYFYPIRNDAASPRFFHMNPIDQLKAERAMEETNQVLIAIVHSHPLSVAFPSQTDLDQAHWPDSIEPISPGTPWLIVSLLDSTIPVVRAFEILGRDHPSDIQELQIS